MFRATKSSHVLVQCRCFKKVLMIYNKVLRRTYLFTGAINAFDANNGTGEHNKSCQLKWVLKWDMQDTKLLQL